MVVKEGSYGASHTLIYLKTCGSFGTFSHTHLRFISLGEADNSSSLLWVIAFRSFDITDRLKYLPAFITFSMIQTEVFSALKTFEIIDRLRYIAKL